MGGVKANFPEIFKLESYDILTAESGIGADAVAVSARVSSTGFDDCILAFKLIERDFGKYKGCLMVERIDRVET